MALTQNPSSRTEKVKRYTKIGAAIAIATATLTGVEKVHIDVKTRTREAIETPERNDKNDVYKNIKQAGMFGMLPAFSITFNEETESTKTDIADGPVTVMDENGLDIPVDSKNTSCPPQLPLCNIAFYRMVPYCLVPNDQCLDVLTKQYGFYPKSNELQLPTPNKGNAEWFNPWANKKLLEDMKSAHSTSNIETEDDDPRYLNWDHRGDLTVSTIHKTHHADRAHSETNPPDQIAESEQMAIPFSLVTPLFHYVKDENRNTPLNKDQVQIMLELGKKLLDEKYVNELVQKSQLSCDDIMEVFTIFINDQLEQAKAAEKSGEKTAAEFEQKNVFMIQLLAAQLGFEKVPNINQLVWVKIPPSMLQDKLCNSQ